MDKAAEINSVGIVLCSKMDAAWPQFRLHMDKVAEIDSVGIVLQDGCSVAPT